MGVAQAEQERAGAGRFLPALEFADAGLGISQDQAIGREILQGELRAGGDMTESARRFSQ